MSLLVSEINFKDSANNSIIGDTTTNSVITGATDLVLQPLGSVNFNNDINCNETSTFINIKTIHGSNNQDVTISSNVSQTPILLQTNTVTCITLDNATIVSSTMPFVTGSNPTLNTSFMNWNLFTNIQSYTPNLTLSSGITSVGYSARGGRYLQYGNMVWFTAFIILSGIFSGSGTVRISLPVATPNTGNNQSLTVGLYDDLNTFVDIAVLFARIPDNATNYFIFDKKTNGTTASVSNLSSSDLTNTSSFVVTGNYYLF